MKMTKSNFQNFQGFSRNKWKRLKHLRDSNSLFSEEAWARVNQDGSVGQLFTG